MRPIVGNIGFGAGVVQRSRVLFNLLGGKARYCDVVYCLAIELLSLLLSGFIYWLSAGNAYMYGMLT
jgi:hypothetical protein